MRRIRIGNDIQVSWEVKTGGESISLEGRQLKLYVRSAYQKQEIKDFVVEGCTISFTYLASMQRSTGARAIILNDATKGSPEKTICADQAFTLVAHSCGENDDDVDFEDYLISLQSNILIGRPGMSAYDLWLQDGHTGTVEDYYAWLQKPASDFVASVSAAEQQRVEAEKERVKAEAEREKQKQESEKQTERAQAAAERAEKTEALIKKAEKARQEAETSRVEAEAARKHSDELRTQNEEARATAESERVKAEEARSANETARVSSEQSREAGESNRKVAESERAKTEIEREANELTRKNNETERKNTEAQRAKSEENREAAERRREADVAKLKQDVEDKTSTAIARCTKAAERAESLSVAVDGTDLVITINDVEG